MHTSYALAAGDFRVERDGQPSVALDTLWPGGLAPDDRLAVLLGARMDALGAGNLIAASATLFYDRLRMLHRDGEFFRYPETFLVGVGTTPGDFSQLDVWPPHKRLALADPTAQELLEVLDDRRVTLLAIPEDGVPTSGSVVRSTWNALTETVRATVVYAPTGRAHDADVTLVGNRVVESYVEQAIFSTAGVDAAEQARLRTLRRALDHEPLAPAERYRTIELDGARELLGVAEVLAPGHQAPSRGPTNVHI